MARTARVVIALCSPFIVASLNLRHNDNDQPAEPAKQDWPTFGKIFGGKGASDGGLSKITGLIKAVPLMMETGEHAEKMAHKQDLVVSDFAPKIAGLGLVQARERKTELEYVNQAEKAIDTFTEGWTQLLVVDKENLVYLVPAITKIEQFSGDLLPTKEGKAFTIDQSNTNNRVGELFQNATRDLANCKSIEQKKYVIDRMYKVVVAPMGAYKKLYKNMQITKKEFAPNGKLGKALKMVPLPPAKKQHYQKLMDDSLAVSARTQVILDQVQQMLLASFMGIHHLTEIPAVPQPKAAPKASLLQTSSCDAIENMPDCEEAGCTWNTDNEDPGNEHCA